jgi:hypothetical protein
VVSKRVVTVVVFWLLSLPLSASWAVGKEHRALFVGNSYTFASQTCGFAGVYEHLMKGAGFAYDKVLVDEISKGGYSLHQHNVDAEMPGQALHQALNSQTPPTVVFLQEQSQTPSFHAMNAPQWYESKAAAGELYKKISEIGAMTVFVQTWGRRDGDSANPLAFPDFQTMNQALEMGYIFYAVSWSHKENPAYIAPIGKAFAVIHGDLVAAGSNPLAAESLFARLYSGDGSHPSVLGSYLGGAVIFAALTGMDPALPEWTGDCGINLEDRTALNEAARRAVVDDPFKAIPYSFGEAPHYPFAKFWQDWPELTDEAVVSDLFQVSTVLLRDHTAGPSSLVIGAPSDGDDISASGWGRLHVDWNAFLEISGTLMLGPKGVVEFPSSEAGGYITVEGDAFLAGTLNLNAGVAFPDYCFWLLEASNISVAETFATDFAYWSIETLDNDRQRLVLCSEPPAVDGPVEWDEDIVESEDVAPETVTVDLLHDDFSTEIPQTTVMDTSIPDSSKPVLTDSEPTVTKKSGTGCSAAHNQCSGDAWLLLFAMLLLLVFSFRRTGLVHEFQCVMMACMGRSFHE